MGQQLESERRGGVDEPSRFPPIIERLRQGAETLVGVLFNGVLLNRYRGGRDSVGWHADDEACFGDHQTIASLSVGGTRTFKFRHRTTKETITLELGSGMWLVMAGDTQKFWQHSVPKTAKPVGPRVNLTFRHIAA